MALRLSRLTGWRATWVLLASAIARMAVRRSITLTNAIIYKQSPGLGAELVALSISVLMVLGVALLGPVISALRKSEEEVRALIESAPEAMVVLDREATILLANAEAGRLFGAFAHQLKGRKVDSLFAASSRAGCTQWLGRFFAAPRRTSLPVDADIHGLHVLGNEFPVQVSIGPLDAAAAEAVAVMVVRDMTEIVRSEAAAQSSESRFLSLRDDVLDNSSVGVCMLDRSFRIVWVNRAFETYLGQDRDSVLGLDARRFVRDRLARVIEDPAGFRDKLLATYQDNTYTEHFECRVLPSGDRWERWLEFWSQPIDSGSYKGGRIEQYAEVTERHNAEERIRQFVDIARNMQVGLFVLHLEDLDDDQSLRVRILNPAGEKLLGVKEADLAGSRLGEAFPKLREANALEMFAGTYRTGEACEVSHFEYGDDNVALGGWKWRAFPLPQQCVGILFERLDQPEQVPEPDHESDQRHHTQ